MFCYGITGAGKTYTMPGPQLCPVPSPVPFAAAGTIFLGSRDIFRKAKGKRSQLPPTRQLRRMLSTQNIGQLSSRLPRNPTCPTSGRKALGIHLLHARQHPKARQNMLWRKEQ